MELKVLQGMSYNFHKHCNEISEIEAKRNADYISSLPHCFTTFGMKSYSIPNARFFKISK